MKGQPRRFKTTEEFEQCFMEYIRECEKKEKLANIAGFCVYADISRETFYLQKDYYLDTFKKIENILEDVTLNAKINDTFKIFYMKNKFQYRDRQEIDNNVSFNNGKLDDVLEAIK